MPVNKEIKKVLVIGSGPIVIGQGAEFDYAGTQACKALMEEGIEVVLINSNPATIMTDEKMADKVYIQPITLEAVAYVIEREKPDGLLATLGGQTGLNMAVALQEHGVLEDYHVQLLGTPLEAIQQAEDRNQFKQLMIDIKEPIVKSEIVSTMEEGYDFINEVGYPVIIRPAYTLGGLGGGIASNEDELKEILYKGLLYSPINQVIIEQSIAGWKEIEYEVMRDANDTCIIVCNMENMDPVGVHTGDSIVVAPSQTLSDKEYHMLRSSAIKIIKALKIEGGCNVQYALHPKTKEYIVIEVNPRVSRSSALASKATGYPIAKISSKIAIGLHLHEIINPVTGKTMASFEPALDYVVTKIPKFPFDKFNYANRNLGTQMQATGEVMAIDRNFESSLLKAIISLEGQLTGLQKDEFSRFTTFDIEKALEEANDLGVFIIAEALRRNIPVGLIERATKIDRWFILKIQNIVAMEQRLKQEELTKELLLKAEQMGFTDVEIVKLSGKSKEEVDTLRRVHDIYPVYKMVDTCAAEFQSDTPYYYSCYEKEDENSISEKEKVVVIGSGPIRIGQGIEFDYASVHASWALHQMGYESIMVNNNPETVSTDFDTSDKLYFEPLYIEDVLNVIRAEMPKGVILQFGGQTSINLADKLMKNGVQILGTSVEATHIAEDRKRFDSLLEALKIPKPKGKSANSIVDAMEAASCLEFPLLVRPSFVIGGRAMQVISNMDEFRDYIKEVFQLSNEHGVLIDEYIPGKEVEVDVICDGEDILIPGIMEHIERTGVHSGDSFCVYPHQNITDELVQIMVNYTSQLAKALKVKGLMNIQFVINQNKVYIIEVNPRASRTIPILSKVTGIPMVQLAIEIIMGKKLKDLGYGTGLYPSTNLVAVKAPVFSFNKLKNVDVALTAEMKSTGEVLGIDNNYNAALLKAFIAAGYPLHYPGNILVSVAARCYEETIPYIKQLLKAGINIYATEGTYEFLINKGITAVLVAKSNMDHLQNMIINKEITMVLNIPTKGREPSKNGFKIRQLAENLRIPCFTCFDTINAYLMALEEYKEGKDLSYKTTSEYK